MSTSPRIDQALDALRELSFIAHREAVAALPAIAAHGEDDALAWLEACRRIFTHDRDAGRFFIEGSRGAERSAEDVAAWTQQALEFTHWAGSAKIVEGFMQGLPVAYETLGEAGERRWAELGLKWCARHLESGRAYFTLPVRELSGRLGITGIEQMLDCAEELFESRRLMLATYLQGALRVRNLLGAKAVVPWAQRGADIMQSGRTRGEAYFRLESEESMRLLLENIPGFRPSERMRLMSLLVEIWFGEAIELKESSWTPEKGRPFVECDGTSLMMPPVLTDQDEAVLALLHSAGHMIFGSYDPHDLQRMFEAAGLPPPAEGETVSMERLLARYGEDAQRFKLIFDIADDLRVDAAITGMVPNHVRRMLRVAELVGAPPDPAGVYYRHALETLRFAAGQPNALGEREREVLAPLLDPGSSIADAHEAALALYGLLDLPHIDSMEAAVLAYLPGRSPNASRAFQQRERSSDSQSRGQREAEDSEGEQQDEHEGKSQQSESQDGAGEQDDSAPQEQQQATGSGSTSGLGTTKQRPTDKGAGSGSSEKGTPYPEWDYREQRHKRNWAWVQEKKLAESNLGEARRLEQEYAVALKKLKQALQAQKPSRLAPERRQFDGEEIDLEAAVSYVTELKAGRSPVDNVYRRRELRQREVSVILLADLSTSIMQLLPEGRGRLVDRVRAGILLFAESLEMVGDSYSIAGFCSKYRDNVTYYTIKDFEEPWSTEVKAQVGGLSGRLATRMGAAIRHATARFNGVSARRRLLLLVSDGRPEDYDDGGDRRYLHEDTRMAVKEAVARGVHPYCITVDTLANEYLPQIFGRGHFLVLDHINSLPRRLPEIYLKLRR